MVFCCLVLSRSVVELHLKIRTPQHSILFPFLSFSFPDCAVICFHWISPKSALKQLQTELGILAYFPELAEANLLSSQVCKSLRKK